MAKQQLNGVSIGLGKIRYSVLGSTGYEIPKELGDGISFTVTPSESTTPLWAGDRQVLVDSSITATGTFADSITHGTSEISFEVIMPEDAIWMSVQSSDEDDFEKPTFETKPVKPVKKVVAG